MGKAKQAKKFAAVKRMISSKDVRLKRNQTKYVEHEEKRKEAM
jgi:U3 small nucleolar RNA-associated protein 24